MLMKDTFGELSKNVKVFLNLNFKKNFFVFLLSIQKIMFLV